MFKSRTEKADRLKQFENDLVPAAADKVAKLGRSLTYDELTDLVSHFLNTVLDGSRDDNLYRALVEIVGKSTAMMPILAPANTRWKLAERKKNEEDLILLYWLPANTGTPFVTWMARVETPRDTFYGHYHRTLIEAFHDFDTR